MSSACPVTQAYLQTSSFDAAKSCLKKVLQMAEGSQGESEGAERQLRTSACNCSDVAP